jgi:hypothetical protein
MIREIFERKNSPFYRFGTLMRLEKISREKFLSFLEDRFSPVSDKKKEISENIIRITDAHPYYTQQMAFTVWENLTRTGYQEKIVDIAADEIVRSHDNDYERIWNSFNRTDMLVLAGLAAGGQSPLSDEFSRRFGTGAASTVFSTLQRLNRKGVLLKEDSVYRIDDPFFRLWIIYRRSGRE